MLTSLKRDLSLSQRAWWRFSNIPGYVVSIGKWSPSFRNSLRHIPQHLNFPSPSEMLYETNRTAVMISSDKLHCSYDIQWRTALQWWYLVTNCTAVMICSDEMHCSYDIQWRTELQLWYPATNCTALISSDELHCSYDIQWRTALQLWYPVTNCTAVMISSDEPHCSDDI